MKRAVSFALALVLVCGLFPVAVQAASSQAVSGKCGDDLTWTYTPEDKTLTVSGTGEMYDYGSSGVAFYAPWHTYYDQLGTTASGWATKVVIEPGVTYIGTWAFDSCTRVEEAAIPDTVTRIGGAAFRNTALSTVTIPASVTSMGGGVFESCNYLTEFKVDPANRNYCAVDGVLFTKDMSVLIRYPVGRKDTSYVVPNGVREIASSAFCRTRPINYEGDLLHSYYSPLVSVTLPEGLEYIGGSAFSECRNLVSIRIPDSVTAVGSYAFSNCLALASVDWPAGAKFDSTLFSSCTSLAAVHISSGNEDFYSQDGVVFSRHPYDPFLSTTGPTLIYYPSGKRDAAYTIPDGVTDVGGSAFFQHPYLQEVDIPGSVENIFDAAFQGCRGLRDVTFHEGLIRIYPFAFITTGVRSFTLPASLESLGLSALSMGLDLESVTVAPGNRNFASEDGVLMTKDRSTLLLYPAKKADAAYVIPDTVTEIANSAFLHSSTLKRVTIPASVKKMGGMAFGYCTNLFSATFQGSAPVGIQQANMTFSDCSKLQTIFYPADDPTWTDAAKSCHGNGYANWKPLGAAEVSGTCGGEGNGENVQWSIQNDVLTISGAGAMQSYIDYYSCWPRHKDYFTSVVIENGVTTIGNSAFVDCPNIESVTIPRSVTDIGQGAFQICDALTDVYYPGSWADLDRAAKPYNTALFNARLHLAFDGKLVNGAGWTYQDGAVALTQAPAAGERVLAATYDESGRLISVETLTGTQAAQLTPSARLKFFLLDEGYAPRSEATSVQTAGAQTAVGGGGGVS